MSVVSRDGFAEAQASRELKLGIVSTQILMRHKCRAVFLFKRHLMQMSNCCESCSFRIEWTRQSAQTQSEEKAPVPSVVSTAKKKVPV